MKNRIGYISYIVAVIFFTMWLVSQAIISDYKEIVETYKKAIAIRVENAKSWENLAGIWEKDSNGWKRLYYECKGKTLPTTQGKSAYFDGDHIVLVEPPN